MAVSKPRVTSPDGDDEGPIAESPDDKIIREAKKRFKKCSDWEAVWRARFVTDVMFVNGDSDNLYQWPQGVRDSRGFGTSNERPCMTVNKTQQHCLQIINDGRQNKTSIKIKPVGDGATYEAAQVMEGIVRHIEYISNAQAVYAHANKYQVWGGIGWCRLMTDYVDDKSFDQDIHIRQIDDPLSVYFDPDCKEPDGSDARFGFVFADVDKDEFERQYPDMKLPPSSTVLGNDEASWIGTDKIRIAEYYYRTEVKDLLAVLVDPITGVKRPIKRSELKGMKAELLEAWNEALKDPNTKKREIVSHDVKWCKIAGNEIVERKDWAGDCIPLAFAIGQQTVINGEMDRVGHVRALKDPQRSYNYYASAAVEYGALQGKSPYLGPMAAFENLTPYYERSNLDNSAWIPYNHMSDDGQPIPPPIRQEPPVAAPVYQAGMENAARDMMLVSGQYQPMMGEPSNERSGKAIMARQRQGENSTYHFIDHQAQMIRKLGKMIIQLFPLIYDTPRTMKILGEDGSDSDIMLDPGAKMAYEKKKAETENAAEQIIMNPTIGRYDVMSDVGPDFATRRQEAFNALSQIASQNPALMAIIGDLVMLAADFPLADEAAERLRRMVPQQALGDGPNPQIVQLQTELKSTQALLSAMSQKLVEAKSKSAATNDQKGIDMYKAFTERLLGFLKYTSIPANELLQFQHELAMQEHAANFDLVGKGVDAALTSDVGNDEGGASDMGQAA